MQFNYSYDPTAGDAKLSPMIADTMRQTRELWRSKGQSVQFINEQGALDEFSFRSIAARDAFIAKNLVGKSYAVSA